MNKNILIIALVLTLAFVPGAQGQGSADIVSNIGNPSSTSSTNRTPVNNRYRYSLTQTIILAEEIQGGEQDLVAISFHSTAFAAARKDDCTIYLQHTDRQFFAGDSDFEPLSAQAVEVGTGSFLCRNDWITIRFSHAFHYDGRSNLLVVVDDNSNTAVGAGATFKSTACDSLMTLVWYSDTENPSPTDTAFSGFKQAYRYRANMKLEGVRAVKLPIVENFNSEPTDEIPTMTEGIEGTNCKALVTDSSSSHYSTAWVSIPPEVGSINLSFWTRNFSSSTDSSSGLSIMVQLYNSLAEGRSAREVATVAVANTDWQMSTIALSRSDLGEGTIFRFSIAPTLEHDTILLDDLSILPPQMRTCTAVPIPENGGQVFGSGVYAVGDTIRLIASANEGFAFSHWQMNGAVADSLRDTLQLVVEDDLSLAAIFDEIASESDNLVSHIGDSSSASSSFRTPVDNLHNYSLTQTIILADEIVGGEQDMTAISFYSSAQAGISKDNCTIYFQHISCSSFADSSSLVALSDQAVSVFSGSLSCASEWNTFWFGNAFHYDGHSNLLVTVDDNSNGHEGMAATFATTACTDPMTLSWYHDMENPSPTDTAFAGFRRTFNYRANMRIVGLRTEPLPFVEDFDNVVESEGVVGWQSSSEGMRNSSCAALLPSATAGGYGTPWLLVPAEVSGVQLSFWAKNPSVGADSNSRLTVIAQSYKDFVNNRLGRIIGTVSAANIDWQTYTIPITRSMLGEGCVFRFVVSAEIGTILLDDMAIASRQMYRCSAVAVPTNGGRIVGAGLYSEGDTISLTAMANDGFVFSHWQSNAAVNDTTINTIRLVADSDIVLTAVFERIHVDTIKVGVCPQIELQVVAENAHWGRCSGSGQYPYGSIVEVMAIPEAGYRFVTWQDGVGENPRQVVVFAPAVLTAIFAPTTSAP